MGCAGILPQDPRSRQLAGCHTAVEPTYVNHEDAKTTKEAGGLVPFVFLVVITGRRERSVT
jgi:hypothetical protein